MSDIAERCQAYETVAQAIRFIRQNARQQPGLEEIAAHIGLSPFHLQRIFSTWAGISPKRFLQYLTRDHARSLLRQSHDVLAAAHASGLSGPARLHDLMIACDAVTPGEVRALGEGLEITYGFGLTPLGRVIAGTTQRGLCHLHFTTGDDTSIAIAELHDEWPQARLLRDDSALAETIACLFAMGTLQAPLHLLLRGTNFQIKVWEALLRIPGGGIVSYQTLAAMVGNPRAWRAVGTALSQNPIALLIPCHRVIRESGDIGQYRWGSERKNALLAYESVEIRHKD
ncbi:MAG: methylated-DNA--[protein]-cysteine S-methyltransferase [Propionivibrio sp.]|uniref:methylated-DNA--[protein]-cysteine S-methyltransferase n=1 Tax=Propionivibrio sp. TaxID=2212460 RepID=UPI001A36DA45|nr:methylated-DNA--[protein]-cysteine S-methyltransferase [Propionivibrio sp.]MBL8416505.1 methylated-DNA--[protein]-cysteine S-methyltransferase [Propionivibrio sp.]